MYTVINTFYLNRQRAGAPSALLTGAFYQFSQHPITISRYNITQHLYSLSGIRLVSGPGSRVCRTGLRQQWMLITEMRQKHKKNQQSEFVFFFCWPWWWWLGSALGCLQGGSAVVPILQNKNQPTNLQTEKRILTVEIWNESTNEADAKQAVQICCCNSWPDTSTRKGYKKIGMGRFGYNITWESAGVADRWWYWLMLADFIWVSFCRAGEMAVLCHF